MPSDATAIALISSALPGTAYKGLTKCFVVDRGSAVPKGFAEWAKTAYQNAFSVAGIQLAAREDFDGRHEKALHEHAARGGQEIVTVLVAVSIGKQVHITGRREDGLRICLRWLCRLCHVAAPIRHVQIAHARCLVS